MTDELFRSEDLLVRRVAGHGGHCCVVTFESFTDFRTLDRRGFGEPFLNGHGIDAIHVISRDNDWYQYPETAEAMAVIHAATRGYGRVVTYGSSMGGYAAIRLAGLVGAQAVLALSPQYSIDPAVVPWEPRWRPSGERFKDVWESTLAFPALDEAYVVYDPTNWDKKHIVLLQTGFAFHPIAIPRGGHPVTGFLAEIGLLQQAILTLSRGAFDAAEFEREAWARRRQSPQYLVTLAQSSAGGRRVRRQGLLREALRIAPGNANVACQLGLELARAGQFEESLAMHRRSLEIEPGHPYLTWEYSFSLEWSGQLDAALALIAELVARTGEGSPYLPRLAELQSRVAARDAPAPPPPSDLAPPATVPGRRTSGWLTRWLAQRRVRPAGRDGA
jgi:hypothetical protein